MFLDRDRRPLVVPYFGVLEDGDGDNGAKDKAPRVGGNRGPRGSVDSEHKADDALEHTDRREKLDAVFGTGD